MVRVLPKNCDVAHRRMVDDLQLTYDLLNTIDTLPAPAQHEVSRGGLEIIVFHVLRRAPLSDLAATFFPRVAMALSISDHRLIQEFRSLPDSDKKVQKRLEEPEAFDLIRRYIRKAVNTDISGAPVVLPRRSERLLVANWRYSLRSIRASAFLKSYYLWIRSNNGIHRHRNISEEFRRIYYATSRVRYLATMLLAAADEIMGSPEDPGANLTVWDRIDLCREFVDRAISALQGQAPRQHLGSVVEIALAAMQQRHLRKERPPHGLTLKYFVRLGPNSYRVMMSLLWHLAVIGDPVDADVLATCPAISHGLEELWKDGEDRGIPRPTAPPQKAPEELVRELLHILEYRCLVFQVGARAGYRREASTGTPNPEGEMYNQYARRYTIHRTVQRVIYRNLDVPLGQARTSDRYSLSLYYSQPSDLPRPTYESHQQLKELVVNLAGYPLDDIDSLLRSANGLLRSANGPDPDWRVIYAQARLWPWRLRAAFGVIVSVYNVAVIGRFDTYPEQESDGLAGGLGHYEAQRQLVHWLLRQTKKLAGLYERMLQGGDSPLFCGSGRLKCVLDGDTYLENRPECPAKCRAQTHLVHPFYKEELIWIYNEIGVLSLVQGRVSDATAMFRQALELSRRRVTTHDASLAARIGLNSAIADIERGASDQVDERLNRILTTEDEDPVIKALARSIKAWIRHLGGELDVAIREYRQSIDVFTDARASRASSMVHKLLGDAYRAKGPKYFDEARETLSLAEKLAREGGHEDAAQLARISQARLSIALGKHDDLTDAQRKLDSVERYAKLVGVPRLTTEVKLVRAEAVLEQGENIRAVQLASEALELATLHDLRLYKARALAVLGQTLERQGVTDAARLVHRRAEELAKRSKYTNMVKFLQDNHPDADPRVTP
jgi:tetratricopeptide (TPR) repeat protein